MKKRNLVAEYLEHFGKLITNELCDYATNEAFLNSRYIFTRREGKQQFGYCTHCRKEYKIEGLKHNLTTICPGCRSKCIAKASGMGRGKLIDRAYFVFYEKSVKDHNVIVARGIYAVRDYRDDYKKVETKYVIDAWYVFDTNNGSKMIRSYSYWNGGSGIEICKSVYSLFSVSNRLDTFVGCSMDSIVKAVANTPFQYSTWEKYYEDDYVKFFDLYSKYPCIEYLTKLGFHEIVEYKLEGLPTCNAINWRGNTLYKVLKLSKKDLKEIKESKVKIEPEFLRLYQISKKDGSNFSIEEITKLSNSFNSEYLKDLQTILKYSSLRKSIEYAQKQYESHSKSVKSFLESRFYSLHDTITNWRDYVSDCIKLEMNLKDDNVLYPKDLYTAHQNTIKQVKIKENEKLNGKIAARVKSLKRYCFEYSGILIRPAESAKELIEEGSSLHHCVGTYAERYANGETSIFLIRKVKNPDKPYYTLELRNNEIVQIHGKNNQAPDKDVSKFVDEFKKKKLSKKKSKIKIPA